MLTSLLSVDEYLGTLVDSLEVQTHQFALRSLELLAVLTLTAMKPSSASACGTRRRVGSIIDVPVMRQIHHDSLAVTSKLPAAIKQLLCRYLGSHRLGTKSQ